MNKIAKFMLLSSLCFPLFACSSSGKENTSNNEGDPTYESIESRAKFDENSDKSFTQTFENGLSDDLFVTVDGAWHTNVKGGEHNGLRSRNLYYTSNEGKHYLAIKAKGYYNKEDPSILGKPEGGGIISKNHLGPGRYEIEMSAMPREGGVTAMWSYCTATGNEETSQNEIDIEIGGTSSHSHFEQLWCTSWTTKTVKETDKVDLSDRLHMNDGKIHKYTFDWYTNLNGERRVDWFVDEVFVKSISGNCVPEQEMPLWIGVWFPPLWAGNASFVEDYLLIEKISYKAFNDEQYYESCRTQPGYIKKKPSEVNIKELDYNVIKNVNKLSNGEFETLDVSTRDNSFYGWVNDRASKGEVLLTEGKTNSAYLLKASTNTEEKYHGVYLKQEITNAYQGYTYDFKIDAKKMTEASVGNIEIYYKNGQGKTIEKEIIPLDSLDYKTYEKEIIMKENSFSLEINITSEDGEVVYDNASLIFKHC